MYVSQHLLKLCSSFLVAAVLLATMLACFDNPEPYFDNSSGRSTYITEVRLYRSALNPNLNREYQAMIHGDTIECMLDYGMSVSAIQPDIYSYGDSITPKGVQDFSNPVTYSVWANGKSKTYKMFMTTSTVPVRKINSIASGATHVLALMNDGTVWACGNNEFGQLAFNDFSSRNVLTQVPIYGVKKLSTGISGTVFILENGKAYGVGNRYGELGLGWATNNTFASITRTPFFDDVAQIKFTLNANCLVLKKDGTMWGAGSNADSLLLTSDLGAVHSKFLKLPIENVQQFSCYFRDVLALKTNGELWAWGTNITSNLGVGDSLRRKSPVKVDLPAAMNGIRKFFCGNAVSYIIDNSGKLWATGTSTTGVIPNGSFFTTRTFIPVPFFDDKNILDIQFGLNVVLFLSSDGTIWCAGSNANGIFANGKQSNVFANTSVAVPSFNAQFLQVNGGSTAWALKSDFSLWAWGSNSPDGGVGIRSTTTIITSPTLMTKTY